MKSYELKILIFLLISLIISFSIINYVVITYVKEQNLLFLNEKIDLMLITKKRANSEILILDTNKKLKDFEFYTEFDGKYVYVKKDYLKAKTIKLSYYLFLWEAVILIFISMFYYLIVYRFFRIRRGISKTFEIILLVLNHKLRNFIASAKLNIELLKYDDKRNFAMDRLLSMINLIENENKEIVERVESFKKLSKIYISKVDLKDLIKKTVIQYNCSKIQLILKLKSIKLKSYRDDLRFIIYLLIDNIYQYAKSYAIIKTVKYKKSIFVVFENDIAQDRESGFGTGLAIVEKLCEANKIRIKRKILKDKFVVIIKFSRFFHIC
ncbi:hypothetical protein [Deferribacter abyssi]|uniref:hypothetical protein n=1 Tax=Deferribacter abyssi TaxID=213806 RepID=UPI003C19108C